MSLDEFCMTTKIKMWLAFYHLFHLGNWNSRKMGMGAGTEHMIGNLQNCCYSSNSSHVRFTELYKPSHWYTTVVKFFLEFFLLHNTLSNKCQCKTVDQLMSFVINYNYKLYNFLNQARAGRRLAHTWFLEIVSVWTSVCMCVCVCVLPQGY